jgi:peptidase E
MLGTVLVLGGSGFTTSNDGTSAIDDYLLALTGLPSPRVCFVPTGSGDSDSYCERFVSAFESRARPSVLSLFGRSPWGYSDPSVLLDQDVVYVGGGSTANLLALWRVHGVADVLIEAVGRGTVLAGVSAGMNCWFEGSATDSFGPLAPMSDGLGILAGSACPHYRGVPGRRETYLQWVESGVLPAGYAIDDFAAALFRDGVLVDAVCEVEGNQVFRVTREGGLVAEVPVPTRLVRTTVAATAAATGGPPGSP